PGPSTSVLAGRADVGPAAAGLDGAAVQRRPSPSWRTRRGVRKAVRQAVHRRSVVAATQRSRTRRCRRTGSLSGALQAQQRWLAARRYASAVCASGARDTLPSGGTGRAPGGAVTVISGSILRGPRWTPDWHAPARSAERAPGSDHYPPVWRAARALGKGHSAGSRAVQGTSRLSPPSRATLDPGIWDVWPSKPGGWRAKIAFAEMAMAGVFPARLPIGRPVPASVERKTRGRVTRTGAWGGPGPGCRAARRRGTSSSQRGRSEGILRSPMEHQPGRTGSFDHRAFESTVDDLSDGRPGQRPLTPAQRSQVAAYIVAIVRRPARAAEAESEEALMLGLWASFRDA